MTLSRLVSAVILGLVPRICYANSAPDVGRAVPTPSSREWAPSADPRDKPEDDGAS